MPSLLFLDLESIPSATPPSPSAMKAPANYKDHAKIEAYQREAANDEWRKESLLSYRGRVLTIAWAVDGERVQSVQHDGTDEEGLILGFWKRLKADLMQNLHVEFVGFNLRAFDLNWLRHRAYRYCIPEMASVLPWQRYDKSVIDIREIWNGAEYQAKGRLEDIAAFLGLTGKTPGIDGSKVFDLWQAGRIDEVSAYCRQDVELTRQVWARMFPAQAERVFGKEAA